MSDEITRELKRIGDEVQVPIRELKERIRELEQKQDRGFGGDYSGSEEAGENVGNLVLKEGNFDAMRAGNLKSFRVAVKAFPLGRKATLTSSDFPGQAYRDPEIYSPLARRFSVRDLLVTKPTTQGSIEFLQSTRTGGAAVQVTEGAVKADLGLGFTLKTTPVRTIAVWIPAARQILDDNAQLKDFIDSQLIDALQLAEDAQLLTGDGTGANILGLLPQASAFARYKANGETSIDQLRRAATQIQLARGVASGIVLNPVDLETIELTKDNEGRYIIELDVTDGNGRTVLWRTPVVITDAIAQGTFLIGDFMRSARMYDRQQANVEVATEHADFFVRNLVAVLAEERVALTVPRPDLLVTGTFNPPANRLPATPGPLLPA